MKNIDDLDDLLKLEESLNSRENGKHINSFSPDEQVILHGISVVFKKYITKMNILNFVFILSKIVQVATVVLLFLMICKVFPYYIVVVCFLMANPILFLIFKLLLSSAINLHSKISTILDGINVQFSEFLFMLENDEV